MARCFALTRSDWTSLAAVFRSVLAEYRCHVGTAKADTIALQDITTTVPERIGRTSYSYVALGAKDLAKAARMLETGDEMREALFEPPLLRELAYQENDGAINIIFMSDDGSDVRLLLKEKAALVGIDIPSARDTTRSFNLYRIVFRDTDGDGRLTALDRWVPYVSDLDGRNLQPIAPDSVDALRMFESFRKDEMFVIARIRPRDPRVPESDREQIVCTYDVHARKLSPVLTNDSLLREARKILQTK